MKGEQKLSDSEKKQWLLARGTRRRGVHNFSRKISHWPFCSNCGLVALKNDVSVRAAKAQCEWEE